MRWLWVLLAAIAGALAGATLLQDPGYVMVRAGDLVFESSIAAAVLTLLLVSTGAFSLSFVARRALQSLGLLGKWRVARRWPLLPGIGAPQLKPWMVFRLSPIASWIGR